MIELGLECVLLRYTAAERALERTWAINEPYRRFDVLYEEAGDEHSGQSS